VTAVPASTHGGDFKALSISKQGFINKFSTNMLCMQKNHTFAPAKKGVNSNSFYKPQKIKNL
ncbi:MAG: hypothetical protein J6S87_01455, partial [Bacteroidales bacterium]|nr:hypothetical protein [Bacteroidales bacterium]